MSRPSTVIPADVRAVIVRQLAEAIAAAWWRRQHAADERVEPEGRRQ